MSEKKDVSDYELFIYSKVHWACGYSELPDYYIVILLITTHHYVYSSYQACY